MVVSAHGAGTQWLAGLRAHDEVDIVGPLGRPFPLPKEPVPTILVGGGYGSAPLFWLAESLRERGCRVEMVLGAASESRLFGVLEARRCADGVTITTDDGSLGQRGWVSDVLPDIIRRTGAGVVYGCGPMGMLRSITEVAAAEGAVAQVAVEESMACGVGVCMTCVMPVEGKDGVTRMVRSCVEGPVFRGDRVRWDAFENGWCRVPADTLGRPGGGWPLMGLFSDIRGQARHPGHSVADAADLTARRAAEPAPGVDMSVDLSGAVLPSPMMTASGCAANGRELNRFFDITELGAFVTKSVMAAPRSGRGTPRMAETPSGMLNSIGLQGPGIEAFVAHDLAWLKKTGARALVSIAGSTSGEFADVAARLRASAAFDAVIGVEVNISCPNVANRGLVFACDPMASAKVIALVREQLPRDMPIFAKLTPDVTDIVTIAQAAVKAGANGLTMINTLLGMVIDTDLLRPQLGGVTGGLSGPAVRPVAVRAIWQVRAAMLEGRLPTVPIIGVGGVRTGRDALELVAAGASAVQVGHRHVQRPHGARARRP